MENEAVNPRKTKKYRDEKSKYDNMSIEVLTLAVVYELYRDMKYKNALALPGRTPRIEEYALKDAIEQRL